MPVVRQARLRCAQILMRLYIKTEGLSSDFAEFNLLLPGFAQGRASGDSPVAVHLPERVCRIVIPAGQAHLGKSTWTKKKSSHSNLTWNESNDLKRGQYEVFGKAKTTLHRHPLIFVVLQHGAG
jgi:hypothetical protein